MNKIFCKDNIIEPENSISNIKATRKNKNIESNKENDSIVNIEEASPQNKDSKNAKPLTTVATFMPRKPLYSLERIVLSRKVKEDIRTLKSRIQNHSILYEDWELNKIDPQGKHVAVNFYGPPGTGKTMCADALATEMGKKIIDVSYAEIESKYVGETGKNIVAAFTKAKETDSVLFFDEADSILGKRMTNVTQAADHGVNVSRAVMLKQLDVFDGLVVFATNLSKNFDGAFVRRILTHIEIPLPDHEGRLELWKKMISEKVPGRKKLNFEWLTDNSSGLSGGEIKNSVVIAMSKAVCRNGSEKCLKMVDIEIALLDTKRAKKDVGNYNYEHKVKIKEKIVKPQDLPDNVDRNLKKQKNGGE